MLYTLSPHPNFPCKVLDGLTVEVDRPGPGRLLLGYGLDGIGDDLVFPAGSGERRDELWKHTCFEAFVREPGKPGYRELNHSAAGWAAYRFDAYREGMANADIGAPNVFPRGEGARRATVFVQWELDLSPAAPWEIGVAAVIEARDGSLSYWALAHPPGRPDFHNADCFTLELAAPEGP